MAKNFFIIACEHASGHFPSPYRALLPRTTDYRAYDLGALTYGRGLARALNAPLFHTMASRLLVDANRSLQHPALHSEVLRQLPRQLKQALIERYHLAYRTQVEQAITDALAQHYRVIHLSVHSFAPTHQGITRDADIGLLYDPQRWYEKQFALSWQARLQPPAPQLRIRRNYPHRRAERFTTALRQRFAKRDYLGLDVEINQAKIGIDAPCAALFRSWFIGETTAFFGQAPGPRAALRVEQPSCT